MTMTPTDTATIRDLLTDSRVAIQRIDEAAAKVGAAADRIAAAADRIPTAEALTMAYWHGAAMGACVSLAIVSACFACITIWHWHRVR
jgi:hypothetical protein